MPGTRADRDQIVIGLDQEPGRIAGLGHGLLEGLDFGSCSRIDWVIGTTVDSPKYI
jgi:hypothetical protein